MLNQNSGKFHSKLEHNAKRLAEKYPVYCESPDVYFDQSTEELDF